MFLRGIMAILLAAACLCAPSAGEELARGQVRVRHHPDDARDAAVALEVVEEALGEFGHRLPPGDAPVCVVVAHDFAEFMRYARSYTQVSVSGVAHSSRGLIVVKAPRLRRAGSDYRGTLRHELVHVLIHRNANTALVPRWLNEGLCMSLANEYQWAAPLTVARMYLGGRLIPYRLLDRAFLMPGDEMEFNDAYAQALSMTRFLRDHLGEDTFWQVFHAMDTLTFGDALRKHAGISPSDFWDAYQRSLWKLALIGILTSGSFFTPAAFLVIIVWFRKRGQNRRTLARWEAEEAVEDAEGLHVFSWDEVVEDPDAWKGDADEEERY